jgi:hypothetical protein
MSIEIVVWAIGEPGEMPTWSVLPSSASQLCLPENATRLAPPITKLFVVTNVVSYPVQVLLLASPLPSLLGNT